jgi:asparagine synthase (glutamine-hydrolysing)
MCGFAGVVNFPVASIGAVSLERMTGALAHRGPDGKGEHWAEEVGLGHRRLAILGLDEGRQPLVDGSTGIRMVFNGEIYNYVELAEELGVAWPGLSDSDVLLQAYLAWGMDMLPRLLGMFAFAIHDPRSACIHLARDRLGIKPLYYFADGPRLVFASELDALMRSRVVPDELEPDAMASYLRMGYVPTPGTIYKGVRKLPPATRLIFSLTDGAMSLDTYWNLVPNTRAVVEAEATEALGELLDTVVAQHLRADVDFGAFLSGGIDSTLMVDRMSTLLRRPVHTFTMGFREDAYSDLPYAEQAARVLGTLHEAEIVSAQISPELLLSLAAVFGEPFADSSFVPTFMVSRLAASRVKMVLSGDGGDELFGGYESYKGVLGRMQGGWRLPVLRAVGSLVGGERGRTLRREGARWDRLHHFERTYMEADPAAEIMPSGRFGGFPDDALIEPLDVDPVLRCQLHDVRHYLLDDILTKVDRMSMANGLEVRVPLLDHRIVEFAFNLPLSARIRAGSAGLETKVLLKSLLRQKFSPDFVDRRKMGFGIPLAAAFHGSLKELVEDLLLGDHGAMASFVDGNAVRALVRDYYSGHADLWSRLWAVLCLRLWFQTRETRMMDRSA